MTREEHTNETYQAILSYYSHKTDSPTKPLIPDSA